MSNPTSVIDLSDTFAQFLARTNQFGETNQTLIQQKFNKKQATGATSPVFAALESNVRSVAQWPNMVDDFIIAAMQDGSPVKSGGIGNIQRFSVETDSVAVWDFDFVFGSGTNLTDKAANSIVLAHSGGGIQAATSIGNLTGVLLSDTASLVGTDASLLLLGDMAIEVIMMWDGAGPSGANLVGHFGAGETEPTNSIYQYVNHSTDGGGVGAAWEFSAGTNVNLDVRLEPPAAAPFYAAMVRDDAAGEVRFYLGENKYFASAFANAPTGGGSGQLVVGGGGANWEAAYAGLRISNAALTDAEIQTRARAVGLP